MPMHTLTKEEQQHRKAAIVQARRAREPWDAIGATWDITPQRAHQIYRAALDEFPAVQVAEHREEEASLADQAISRLMAIADDPDVSARTRVEAWSSIRGWCQHKAALLGLNSPTRREVTVLSESTVDLALAKAAADHAAKVAELEALEDRAISEAGRLLG
jgi:hypothetical protein